MTEADGGAREKAARPPTSKRARRRASGKAKAAPKPAEPKPAPAGAAKSALSPAPAELNQIVMAQTAETLAALSANLTQAMTHANQVFSTAFLEQARDGANWRPDPLGVQPALNEVWSHLAQQPETLRDAHAKLWQRYADIWQKHAAYMLTGKAPDDEPSRDKRFRDPEWRSNPAFSMLRESYLATSQFITDLVEQAEGVDEAAKRKAAFFIKQAVDAASPSNFLVTNPAALRALLQTKGESLVKGVNNLADDIKRGRGGIAITQTDMGAYKVGENIATAPGKVVFRNRVFELIQYAASSENVHETPLLIFPPWINKF